MILQFRLTCDVPEWDAKAGQTVIFDPAAVTIEIAREIADAADAGAFVLLSRLILQCQSVSCPLSLEAASALAAAIGLEQQQSHPEHHLRLA